VGAHLFLRLEHCDDVGRHAFAGPQRLHQLAHGARARDDLDPRVHDVAGVQAGRERRVGFQKRVASRVDGLVVQPQPHAVAYELGAYQRQHERQRETHVAGRFYQQDLGGKPYSVGEWMAGTGGASFEEGFMSKLPPLSPDWAYLHHSNNNWAHEGFDYSRTRALAGQYW
jgi:hypothetical protein